jgi:hypothetical protein
VAAGVKVVLSVHEAPAAKEVPHPVSANSGLLLETVIGIAAVVLFFTVRSWAGLVVPKFTEPNAAEAGKMVIGATPVPVTAADAGLPTPV